MTAQELLGWTMGGAVVIAIVIVFVCAIGTLYFKGREEIAKNRARTAQANLEAAELEHKVAMAQMEAQGLRVKMVEMGQRVTAAALALAANQGIAAPEVDPSKKH